MRNSSADRRIKRTAQGALDQFLVPLVIANFDEWAAAAYGKLRAILETQGALIGSPDMLIAAHALSLGVTPVTNNIREFSRIPHISLVQQETIQDFCRRHGGLSDSTIHHFLH